MSARLLCCLFLGSLFVCANAPPTRSAAPPGQTASPKTDEPFELKGDKVGETLEQFKSHNPKAQCEELSANIVLCRQWVGVTIAGAVAAAPATCTVDSSGDDCWEGLSAAFTGKKLTALNYTVDGEYLDIVVSAFKKKYGPPRLIGKSGPLWEKALSILSIGLEKKTLASGVERTFTVVQISFKDLGSDKDI